MILLSKINDLNAWLCFFDDTRAVQTALIQLSIDLGYRVSDNLTAEEAVEKVRSNVPPEIEGSPDVVSEVRQVITENLIPPAFDDLQKHLPPIYLPQFVRILRLYYEIRAPERVGIMDDWLKDWDRYNMWDELIDG